MAEVPNILQKTVSLSNLFMLCVMAQYPIESSVNLFNLAIDMLI